jgi:Rieske Fe-S protein
MERRNFLRFCAASAVAAGTPAAAAPDAQPRFYSRARLVGARGEPLRASAIPAKRNLIFNYPYASTPCFLLNLGHPAGEPVALKTADRQEYVWRGGVGTARSIVAYSALCAHRLAYPTRDISFISFRTEKTPASKFAEVIHCCSEHSQYDPAQGARVVAGPAPQPLAAILLEHEPASDGLYAVGTLGGEMFNEFFRKYEFKLNMEMGPRAHNTVADTCPVQTLDSYCRQQVKC